jgi:4-amino-4-deoxy-L-arabinose transferase-like glycosyltransferase
MKLKEISRNIYLKWMVIGILVLRAILLAVIPLMDKTEARYGEIARLMYETRQWVMLQYDYGLPFWAKPPLSSWLSAGSFELFGVNEIAARLPSFLIAIVIIIIVIKATKITGAARYVLAFILLTIPEYLIHAGVTSTDSSLLLCIVLVMLGFWKTVSEDNRSYWSYLFFVGIGLGLLAKGPIIIILTGPPLFVWCLLAKGRFKRVFLRLPWITGILIVALIAVPWYWLAEQESPGFVDYFIVGEHFKRFTESGWSGDKYGFAKSQPIGMIWLFLLAFAFPWIQIALYHIWKKRKTLRKDPWVSFLLLWLFWSPLFFTVSRNVIHTYVLPSTIPLALLMLHWWNKEKYWVKAASFFPIAVAVAAIALSVSGKWSSLMNTDKYLMKHQEVATTHKEVPVLYWDQKSYSGRFYAQRPVHLVTTEASVDSMLQEGTKFFLFVRHKNEDQISEGLKQQLILLESSSKRSMYTNLK